MEIKVYFVLAVVVIDNRVLQGPGSGEAAIYVWKRRLVSDWRGRYQMDLIFTGRLNLDLFFFCPFLSSMFFACDSLGAS